MKPHALAFVPLLAAACSVETGRGEVGIYRAPESVGVGGAPSAPEPDAPLFFLPLRLRDFKKYDASDAATNPAFGNGDSEGHVVEAVLGPDQKPVYRAPDDATPPTFGKEYFDQWYRDVPGTNLAVVFPLPLALDDQGFFAYDSQKTGAEEIDQGAVRRVFFPLDDGSEYQTPFGNQGAKHNYGFTGELHATFTAAAGQTLELRSDDDLYAFIDDSLVVDLGGTHVALPASVALDDLGFTPGEQHSLHVFYAERKGGNAVLALRSNFALAPMLP